MQYMNIIFVCKEELKGDMQGYSCCLIGNQLKFQLQPFGCKHARAQLYRKNYSRNFSSIRSGPKTLLRQWHSGKTDNSHSGLRRFNSDWMHLIFQSSFLNICALSKHFARLCAVS